jgi:hypothetical protein
MPQSIPKGLGREHVLRALADLDAGIEHPFGLPTGYELVHEGKRYPPKAVIGLAFRHLTGQLLRPEEFSGGEAPGQANSVLRGLGFTVVKKVVVTSSEETEDASERGRAWSRDEVDLIVADYFTMLRAELAGEPFSKAEHNRALQPLLSGRSKGSIEFTDRCAEKLTFSRAPDPLGRRRTAPDQASDEGDRPRGGIARAVPRDPDIPGSSSPRP